MKKEYYYTYQTKNIITGKTYIGVHSTNNLNDGYIGSGIKSQASIDSLKRRAIPRSYFLKSLIKYGYCNFKVEILNFFDSRKEMLEEEAYLVDEKWVRDPYNYNTALGGIGGSLRKHLDKFDSIREAFLDGNLVSDICTQFKVCNAIVAEALKGVDKSIRVNKNSYYHRHRSKIPVIISCMKNNEPLGSIAKRLSMCTTTLNALIRRHNLKYPPKQIYIAIHKDGSTDTFDNIKNFEKKWGVLAQGVRQVLQGNITCFKGWFFMPIEKYNKESFVFPKSKYDVHLGLKLKDPYGTVHVVDTDLKTFCDSHDLNVTNLYSIFNGKMEQHKGWTVESTEYIKQPFVKKPLKFEHLKKDIELLLKDGVSIRAIAKQLDATVPSIKTVITKFKLK